MSGEYTPIGAKGACINVTGTTAALTAVAMPGPAAAAGGADSVLLFNEGPNNAWVAIGASTVLATLPTTGAGVATCTPIPAGAIMVYTRDPANDAFISTITRTGTCNISVMVGDGS